MHEDRIPHLIITGGTGYIGQRLAELAVLQGRTVTLIGRRPGYALTRHIPWTLGEPFPLQALDPALPPREQALVHLAHDWQGDQHINVNGSAALFDAARAAGLGGRVFISSQSAREHALNRYGRTKWLVEQRLGDDISLRVGLVYGGPMIAMYGLLCLITGLPILPMVDPHRCVQPIHRDEVVHGILAAIDGGQQGVFALAGPEPMPFGDVLRAFARTYYGRWLPVLPVPLRLALWICDMTARLPLVPTIDRERVLGLAGTEPIESASDLARLGIAVKPLMEGLALEPSARRALLSEARAFLRHAMHVQPAPVLLKRYVRAFDGPIARPHLFLGWQEPIGGTSRLATRLRAAARIAETGVGAEQHLSAGSRFGQMTKIAASMFLEALKLPIRLVLGACWR